MYIWDRKGLGEETATTPGRITMTMRPKPNLDLNRFDFNRAALTQRLATMVNNFADAITRSWQTKTPVNVIRLTGHTDWSGDEKYNVGLGDRRAQAVEAALRARLKGLADRIMIVVKPSPGETLPIADNRTADGRERNRRVEVFIETGLVRSPTQPGPTFPDPTKITVPPESVIITKPNPIFQPIPEGPKPRSLQNRLEDILSGIGSQWLRENIRNAVISGSCSRLEGLFRQAGGSIRESGKEELRKQCTEAWKKPVR
jgi:hypothetical protein